MTTHKSQWISTAVVLISLLAATAVFARSDSPEPVGHLSPSSSGVQWLPAIDHERIDLTIVAPDGTRYSKQFPNGNIPAFRLQDLGTNRPQDGTYTYELRVIPRISESVKRQLAMAREANDDAVIARIQHAAGIDRAVVQSGALTVINGLFINSEAEEPPAPSAMRLPAKTSSAATGAEPASASYQPRATPLTVVTADNEVIQGSLCVGLDCVSTESFGFDTIRLKENNTRIHFFDTSTSTGFPNVNWQLTANDSASGGANKFSIDDLTNAVTPFTVMADAPTNSLFVSSNGKVGLGNGSPVLNLHITATDTPAIRQEQTSGGGFTAQTWDIGANEANWFVRDVTGGSRLPLRIRPGAPTSSIDISASGNVGVGTPSPANKLDVTGAVGIPNGTYYRAQDSAGTFRNLLGLSSANRLRVNSGGTGATITLEITGVPMLTVANSGNIGVGTTTPSNPIEAASGAFLSAGGVWTNASSRAYKNDIRDLDGAEALETVRELNPVTFTYKREPGEHHVGFIAEDVPQLVATADRKSLSSMDIVAVLTKVVQEQQKTIDELKARVDELSNKQ